MKMPSEISPESVFTYQCTGDVCAGDTMGELIFVVCAGAWFALAYMVATTFFFIN